MGRYTRSAVWILAACILFLSQFAEAAWVYRTESNSSEPPELQGFDTEAGTWTILATLPASNTTQLAASDTTIYALPEDGNVYSYDAGTDAWNLVMAGPPEAVGRNAISMLETYNGEFYWGADGTSTLHYTKAGVWTSITTPAQVSSAADFDRSTGILYIRTYNQLGHMAFNTNTETFLAGCPDATNVGENSRTGVYFGGGFYSRTWDGNLIRTDVQTCAQTDTGTPLSTEHSSSAVDASGNIYLNGYSTSVNTMEVYSISTGQVTALPDAPTLSVGGGHGTLAVLGAGSIAGVETVPVPATSFWMLLMLVLGMAGIAAHQVHARRQ